MDTATETQNRTIAVELTVCHGDYRATFYGSGSSILEAAEEAAAQSSYSAALFDPTDGYYSRRASYRDELQAKLAAGEVYRGFGWCDFRRIS